MKRNHEQEGKELVRMELKYCERCGGLWVRESGSGAQYCDPCVVKIAELPPARKQPGRLTLPVRPNSVVEDYELGVDENELEAVGGVA